MYSQSQRGVSTVQGKIKENTPMKGETRSCSYCTHVSTLMRWEVNLVGGVQTKSGAGYRREKHSDDARPKSITQGWVVFWNLFTNCDESLTGRHYNYNQSWRLCRQCRLSNVPLTRSTTGTTSRRWTNYSHLWLAYFPFGCPFGNYFGRVSMY